MQAEASNFGPKTGRYRFEGGPLTNSMTWLASIQLNCYDLMQQQAHTKSLTRTTTCPPIHKRFKPRLTQKPEFN
jgi:hypothetical protein